MMHPQSAVYLDPEPLDWIASVTARRAGRDYDLLLTVHAPKLQRLDVLKLWCRDHDFIPARPAFFDLDEHPLDIAAPAGARQPVRLCAIGLQSARQYDASSDQVLLRRDLPRITLWKSLIGEEGDPASAPELHDDLFPAADSDALSGLHSYALIDANRYFGIAEMLGNSGLRYHCLFKGEAARNFADAAPYLVEILPRHPFTRRMFTKRWAEGVVSPWEDGAVSFVVSPLSIDGIHAHLRLFTQVKEDKSGKNLFFRFYAPEVMRSVIPAIPPDTQRKFARAVSRFICPDGKDGAAIIEAGLKR